MFVKSPSCGLQAQLDAGPPSSGMPPLLWLPLMLQLVAPLGLIAVVGARARTRLSWSLRVLLASLYTALLSVAGVWLVLPWYLPVAYAAAILLAAIQSGGRLADTPAEPTRWQDTAISAGLGLGTLGSAGALALALAGHRLPPDAVRLSFPLHQGTYLVVNGGGTELINAHLRTLADPRFSAWRGQSRGVDVVRLNAAGLAARGLLPGDPAAYTIYGDSVAAPCAGRVVAAVDGIVDMRPPETDRRHMAGNHVILGCGEIWVVLGHLRPGSVTVHPGDSVAVGAPIGRVGNSGNTDEPHLHIHAQRPATGAAPLSGEPLPIRFGATYPTRNVRILALGPT